jgi:uncharacterized protein with FMN-binding domain
MNQKKIITLVVIGIIGISVIVFLIFALSSDSSTNTSNNTVTADTGSTTTYKDGDYSSSVSYTVQRNSEKMNVSLTIADNKVKSVDIENITSDRESKEYQDAFEGAYKKFVVDKNINSVSMSRVSGASETTDAFMKALQQIKNDAKS